MNKPPLFRQMPGKCAFIVLALTSLILTAGRVEGDEQQKVYDGDKVLRLVPANEAQFKLLGDLIASGDYDESGPYLDYWSEPKTIGKAADLYVRHDKYQAITGFLDISKIAYKVIVDDVQSLINDVDDADKKHRLVRMRREAAAGTAAPSIVGKFVPYLDISNWLQAQCAAYPKLANCGSYGKSFEGRDLRYIRVGATPLASGGRRSILVEGGIHAREWLSPATIVYVVDKLLSSYDRDANIKKLLDNYEIFFMPSVNPDGYEYSRAKERLWRKTRSNVTSQTCLGVDGNRNFDIRWASIGSHPDPCSNTYHGPKPFSEPEMRAIADFVMTDRQKWLAFFSMHSYSQYWMVPYGFALGAKPQDYAELLRVANVGGAALIAANGRDWRIGNTVNLTYPCSGSSDDWAKAVIGIKYAYTFELYPSANSLTGFVVGEADIEPSGQEILAGLVASISAMEQPTEDNSPDAIAIITPESGPNIMPDFTHFPSSDDDEDDELGSFRDIQIFLAQLGEDIRSLTKRVDTLDTTCTSDVRELRERAGRLEAQLPRVESKVSSLDTHSDVLWKAVATTQHRQMTIQRQLLEASLTVVVTPRFVPHVVTKDSLLGETLKLGEDVNHQFVEALRKIDVDGPIVESKTKKPRVHLTGNGTEEQLREFLLESRQLNSSQRATLLNQSGRTFSEQAGFWFEPQYSEIERHARRTLETQLGKLKAQYGDSLKFSLKALKLTTNHGDYYYDTVSKRVFPVGAGNGNGRVRTN